MAAVLQQTRTTRSTRVSTSSSISSLRAAAAKTPVQQQREARTPIQRDARTPVQRDIARAPIQRDARARTPLLRETRSRRELAAAASAASAPPVPPLPVGRVRTPSPAPSQFGVLEGPSPLSLFVTNIKLLDFDLLPGWPRITVDTFAPPGTGTQGQKKRIHCAEWVLFQLFSIWDPEETANKLKPFYPPLDQNQSTNLRAAFIRSLEQAKKNGALGRDTVVRKTMLDDCKGDRLEEVLAYFSTAVLKKVVMEQVATSGAHVDPALSFATQKRGYRADKTELRAIALSYRASLQRLLEQKEATRVQYRGFAALLSVKEGGIARRNEAVLAKEIKGAGQSVSDNARAEMRRTLRNNWSGSETWMETLLSGDAKEAGLVTTPFDKVWRRVQQGRLGELEAEGTGLLQQLESRVQVQKERLQKWNAFRRDMFGQSASETPSKARVAHTKPKGIDLGFEDHMDLHIGRVSRPLSKIRVQEPKMSADYATLVSDLNEDLARISKKDVNLAKLFASKIPKRQEKPTRRGMSTSSIEDDSASEISDLEDAENAFRKDVPIRSFQDKLAVSNGQSLRPRLSRPDLTSISTEGSTGPSIPIGKRNFPGKSAYDIDQFDLPQPSAPPPAPPKETKQTKPTTPPAAKRKPYKLDTKKTNHSRSLKINFDTMDHPSPSPMKRSSPSPIKRTKPRHTLSLSERTQLSLTRKSSFFLDDEEPELVHEPASMCSSMVEHTGEELDAGTSSSETADDLVSRTKRSMAGFEQAQQRAQLERRRSQRRAKALPRKESGYFPRVEEDLDNLVERLAEEEDMEAVFRSRPKIAQHSPTKEWGFSDYYG
ncbi:hypothetical protein PT974_09797 [Cladobotryum mycophilum]|uniref:HAUS augmin-like complex subunit 6 N-terminal domain-containing protein n=1 Tax=Cladobotryum mycophilum TaxID=491253 RepID=A0ABR0SH61_9HYPO